MKKIMSYSKQLRVGGNSQALISFILVDESKKNILLSITDFLALSHVLENDEVFFEESKNLFLTRPELSEIKI